MEEQIKGQMDIFDFIENPSETLGEKLTKEGFTNAWDRMPDHDCEVMVIDHNGNRFRTKAFRDKFGSMVFDATKSSGYDICWWMEVAPILQTCESCIHFRHIVNAYTCEPIDTSCIKNKPFSVDVSPGQSACKNWRSK